MTPRIDERYVAERPLGSQPAGRFLAAVDTVAGGRVTVFIPDLTGSGCTPQRLVADLSAELRRCRPLAETAYCTLKDAGLTADGQAFVVVDRPQGHSIAAMIEGDGHLGAERAISIAIQLCDLARRAHAVGIVPAALTPESVIVDARAGGGLRVSVVDLGLHRAVYGAAVAPPALAERFESPQRRRGQAPDPRDDVYTITALLHLMLFGVAPPPMAEHGPADGSGWPLLPADGRGLDRRLEACLHTVLLRGLAREREERLPTLDALQRALAGLRQLMSLSAPAFELLAATRSRLGRRDDPLAIPAPNPALDRAIEARARIRRVMSQAVEGGASLTTLAEADRRRPAAVEIVDIRQAAARR